MQLNTLYEIIDGSGDSPLIEVVGGTITLYTWLKLPTSSPISDDFNASETIESTDIKKFKALPKYVYAVQASGTTTAINLAGCRVEAV